MGKFVFILWFKVILFDNFFIRCFYKDICGDRYFENDRVVRDMRGFYFLCSGRLCVD